MGNQNQKHRYVTAKLKDAIRLAIFRYTNSSLFQWGKGIFNFSLSFNIVSTIWGALKEYGVFGTIVLIVIVPVAVILDIFILIFGISIGIVLSVLALIKFIFILFFSLLKAVFTK